MIFYSSEKLYYFLQDIKLKKNKNHIILFTIYMYKKCKWFVLMNVNYLLFIFVVYDFKLLWLCVDFF